MFNPARLLIVIFLTLGVIFLGAGVFLAERGIRFGARAMAANGRVTQLRYSHSGKSGAYYPEVEFQTQDGRRITFMGNVGTSPPAYRTGEAVAVLYDPENPERAEINSFWSRWFLTVMFGGFGAIFSAIPTAMVAVQAIRRRRERWLRQFGQRITTKFERVELNRSLRVNGASPYRIVSQWLNPVTHQVHVFRSGNLWFDPSEYVAGQSVDVWIDPANPKRYAVDLSFLPKLAD